MNCKKCGRQIGKYTARCPYCGVHNSGKMDDNQINRHNKRWVIVVVSITFVLLVVVILAILVLNGTEFHLSKEDAQMMIVEAVQKVYQESSSENFISQQLAERVNVEVTEVSRQDDMWIVTCSVTSVDMEIFLLEYFQNLDSEQIDTYNNVVLDLQQKLMTAPEMKKVFTVKFERINDEITFRVPEEMVVFCSGNIQNVLPKIYEILQGGA